MSWPILVLSLPGCEARQAPLLRTLAALGLEAEIVHGVDGRRGLPPAAEAEVDRKAARRAIGRDMLDAELACALSHRAIHALIAARGLPGAVVLEDDAIPTPGLAALLAAGAEASAGLLLFDYDGARVMRGSRRTLLPGIDSWELATNTTLSTGYAISRATAAALREAATPVRGLADWPCDITRLGARVVAPRLVLHPAPGPAQSLIGGDRSREGLGLARTRKPLARFAEASYWRRWWRKRRGVWLVRKGEG
jgi:glycosyl transferase family 25